MKAIHTVSSIAQEASGPTYSVVNLCRSLAARGVELSLLTLDAAEKMEFPDFVRPFPWSTWLWRLGRSPQMSAWLKCEVAKGDVEIVHTHGLWLMPNVYPGRTLSQNARLVVSPRGTLSQYAFGSGSVFKPLFWHLIQHPAIAHATAFHATAESECEDIRRMGFRQPVAVIPNGVGIPTPLERPRSDRRTLLYLGRLHPEKGVHHLIGAWGAVEAEFPDWDLRIVGPGRAEYVDGLRAQSSRLGLRRAEFTGPLYGDAKALEYASAELSILPSPSENFGVSVAESLAAGTPVIATQGTPWRGLVDRDAGWWVELEPASLEAGLREALSTSPARLARMGMNGRQWMIDEYSWEGIASRMDEFYHWIGAGGTPPSFVRLAQ